MDTNDKFGGNYTLPTMHIYRSNRKIISKEFKNNLLIRRVIDTNELYWIADDEPVPDKGPSGLQIWIRGASVGGEIHYVLPYWQLIIDSVSMEPGFYDRTINVGGREVELQYRDYRFVCAFPANKDRPPTKIEDLHPDVPADDVK
jgi:hypothetical protein